jgi:dihydropteroate synthase
MQQPLIMGVLNITPDSFSDGGKYFAPTNALKHAEYLIQNGADIIDIGAESSRPYAQKVPLAQELKRIIPIVKSLKENNPNIKISVDTYKAEVMAEVLDLGVEMINDIYALSQAQTTEVIANSNCDICLMHMLGNPQTMQDNPQYGSVVDDILSFFESKINYCNKNGISENRIILDPGFGFGKTLEHNLAIIKNLDKFKSFGLRLLIGVSKKSMFDKILGDRAVDGRIISSVAFEQFALTKGVDIIRTHSPQATSDMIKTIQAIQNYDK